MRRWIRLAMERLGLRRSPFYIRDNPDYHNLEAGAFSYGKPLIMGADGTPETKVSIGRFCSIGDGVRIMLRVNHPTDAPTTYPLASILGLGDTPVKCRGPVRIGHDVWIGQDALIFGGVTLGNGTIVGARAVVTRDVPPYGIAVGNPARVVRKRFGDSVIKQLEATRWWDWPEHLLRQHAGLLSRGPIDEFLRVAAQLRTTTPPQHDADADRCRD